MQAIPIEEAAARIAQLIRDTGGMVREPIEYWAVVYQDAEGLNSLSNIPNSELPRLLNHAIRMNVDVGYQIDPGDEIAEVQSWECDECDAEYSSTIAGMDAHNSLHIEYPGIHPNHALFLLEERRAGK